MFKMIGGDGREYGPVTAAQLREWIADNRAGARTLVQEEGTGEWKALSALPEFAEDLRAAGAVPGAAVGAAGGAAGPLERDYTLEPGHCLARGWLLLRRRFFLLAVATGFVWLMVTVGPLANCLGAALSLAVAGALHGGLMVLYLKTIREQPARLGDVLCGFGASFIPLMLIWIVTQMLSAIGMALCILPGIYLKVIWVFSLALAADRGLGFWPALEASRRAVSRHWFAVAALVAVAYLPVIAFSIYTSLQVAMQVMDAMGGSVLTLDQASFLRTVKEAARASAPLQFQQRVVLLLNLPFAYAALLYGYEDIFGPRRP